MTYRYEDLGDEAFQRLCGALLVHLDNSIQVPPLGHSDGGFDAFRRSPFDATKVDAYQVKWTAQPQRIRNPVGWVTNTLAGERENLKRMGEDGTKTYLLITNVRSTAVPRRGTMDRTDAELVRLAKEVGVDIRIWWRNDLDVRLDAAPSELKFAYPEMLVGPDAMRALLADALTGREVREQADLLRAAMRTQFNADSIVGFRQATLDGVLLDDLFIDVSASPRFGSRSSDSRGALEQLLSADFPRRSMFLGAPGQGKSTLVQKLCQDHRGAFLSSQERVAPTTDGVRIAFKVILRDYAAWLTGRDPFAVTDIKRPRGSTDSIESFVAHQLHVDSGGLSARAEDVMAIGQRFPTLFAFDGLDEVADIGLRRNVVDQIVAFDSRSGEWDTLPRIVVTSRPSFERLPEPSNDVYLNHVLDPLSEPLRISYLRKWARTQALTPPDRRDIERIFLERSAEPHVLELATNPMQLTILLYLISQRGESVPHRRTELYGSYLQSFLDREAAKSNIVRKHRDQLEDVMAFLGWYLQSRAESERGNGRAPRDELVRVMKIFLLDTSGELEVVEELFTAVTTRVWTLISRLEGTFEFDVQSIREYFAARYIFDRAPGSGSGASSFDRFREVIIRPYWVNVARFMGGMFRHGEKAHLADVLIGMIDEFSGTFWMRRVLLLLIADGVFDRISMPRQRLLVTLCEPIGVRALAHDLETGQAQPVSADRGGTEIARILREALSADPSDPIAPERARVLVAHQSPDTLVDWWINSLDADPSGRLAWIRIARELSIGALLSGRVAHLLETPTAEETSLLLEMGYSPAPEEGVAQRMLLSVLGGRSIGSRSTGKSMAAALAQTIDLSVLVDRMGRSTGKSVWNAKSVAALRRYDDEAATQLVAARRMQSGDQGTTMLFATLGDRIQSIFGRCTVANAIAIMGAVAGELRMGHRARADDRPFGVSSVPSAILRDVRGHEDDATWWAESIGELEDEIDRTTWLLGLLAGGPKRDRDLLTLAAQITDGLSADARGQIRVLLELLANKGVLEPADIELVVDAAQMSLEFGKLIGIVRSLNSVPVPGGLFLDDPQWRDMAAVDLWGHRDQFDDDDADLLAQARVDLELVGDPIGVIPAALSGRLRVDSPWALHLWRERSHDHADELVPLDKVAEQAGWFQTIS